MPPHVARLAWQLNALGEQGDGRILASLYRYLANRPAALAASGQLDAGVGTCSADAEGRAWELVPRLCSCAAARSMTVGERVVAALEEFGRNAIPKVIPGTGVLLVAFGSPALPALYHI